MITQTDNYYENPEKAFAAWIFCFNPDGDESPSEAIEGDSFEEVEMAAKRWKGAKVIVMFDQEGELCQFGRITRRRWLRYESR